MVIHIQVQSVFFHRATPPAVPDSWMVTPNITVTSSDFYLSFWEATHEFSMLIIFGLLDSVRRSPQENE